MPPKRKTSPEGEESSTKKPKVQATPLDPNQPTNKQLPDELSPYDKPENVTRFACWNIAGYNASVKKGLHKYIKAEPADLLVLTETKIDKEPNDEIIKNKYKHSKWVPGVKKGHAGIAILWNGSEAISTTDVLPTHPEPESTKGRIIILEFKDVYVIGTYVPNAGSGLKNLEDKKVWNEAFKEYLHNLGKNTIWLGDLNVCHDNKDLRNDKSNWNKTPGWTEAEVSQFKEQLSDKFIDVWREHNPDEVGQYSYWGYRFNARVKGIGWRLDYVIISKDLSNKVKNAIMRAEIYGASDHVPVIVDLDSLLL
ncbi:hypothetical protein E3Q23_02713 [Wallemia mellicola]|uniref:DNase I-like protein n=1 Tax=Wallemia mellicola TaxID=1708541 RepID=A0A4T0TFH5_9BASI|nr:hypothetical protein E3Q23_02713 [Wallemia mellicola]TIC53496.1 DNase I-like protein [Wallemia mellicola]TIC64155.1 DNase I-like protein [Wallemia mellicola]